MRSAVPSGGHEGYSSAAVGHVEGFVRTVGSKEQDLGRAVEIDQAFFDSRALAGNQQVDYTLDKEATISES